MKVSVFLLLSISACFSQAANPEDFQERIATKLRYDISKLENTNFEVPEEIVKKLEAAVENEVELENFDGKTLRSRGEIISVVNGYADILLRNFSTLLTTHGFDPLELPSQKIKLFPGSLELTQGWLQELTTLKREGDLSVVYSHGSKKMVFSFPLKFDNLLFTYKYRAKALLLSVHGGVDGKVKNVRIFLKLEFDFNKYQARLAKIDITRTGGFSIHFTGHGLVDWLVNTMTGVTTAVMKPLILSVVQLLIRSPASEVVNKVNEVIRSLLHPHA